MRNLQKARKYYLHIFCCAADSPLSYSLFGVFGVDACYFIRMQKPYNNQTTTLPMRSSLNLSRYSSPSPPNTSPTKTLQHRLSLRHDSLGNVHLNAKQNRKVQGYSRNRKEVGEMQSFVEQMSMDPSLILRLIDYKTLAEELKKKNGEIAGRIVSLREELQRAKQRAEMLMGKECQRYASKIRKEQVGVQQQIKEYSTHIQQLQQTHKQKHTRAIDRIVYLNSKIKQVSQQAKTQIACFIQSLSKKKIETQSLKDSIDKFMQKNKKLMGKFYELEENNRNIERLIHRVSNKKAQIFELAKTQQERTLKLKEDQVKKNKTVLEMKAKSEKKLKKFVEEVCRIIEKGEVQNLSTFADQYLEKNPKTREKNETSDTAPQDGPLEKKYESEMKKMEASNPQLKDIKEISLKSTGCRYSIKQMTQNLERSMLLESEHFLEVKSLDEKAQKLEDQERQSNTFLQALSQKIAKIEQEIKLVKVPTNSS